MNNHEIVQETLEIIGNDLSEVNVYWDQDATGVNHSNRISALIEFSTLGDDSHIPDALRSWPVVENLIQDAEKLHNQHDVVDYPQVGAKLEFQFAEHFTGLKVSPYFTRSEDGEQVFVLDKIHTHDMNAEATPKALSGHLLGILHNDKYHSLNAELDRIRDNPLLILEADKKTRQAAANVNIHLDWISNPDAWQIIENKVQENVDKFNRTVEEYKQRREEMWVAEHVSYSEISSFDDKTPYSVLIAADDENAEEYQRSLDDMLDDSKYFDLFGDIEYADPAQIFNISPMDELDDFKQSNAKNLLHHQKMTAQDTWYDVKIADTELAKNCDLHLDKQSMKWFRPPDASFIYLDNKFKRITAPTQSSHRQKEAAFEM